MRERERERERRRVRETENMLRYKEKGGNEKGKKVFCHITIELINLSRERLFSFDYRSKWISL